MEVGDEVILQEDIEFKDNEYILKGAIGRVSLVCPTSVVVNFYNDHRMCQVTFGSCFGCQNSRTILSETGRKYERW